MNSNTDDDLKQAASDELDIVQAGLYEAFSAELEYQRIKSQSAPSGYGGPLEAVHGDRWRWERKAREKQRADDSWKVGCSLALHTGCGVDTGVHAAQQAFDDVYHRVRSRFVTIAHQILCGVQVDLPHSLADEICGDVQTTSDTDNKVEHTAIRKKANRHAVSHRVRRGGA